MIVKITLHIDILLYMLEGFDSDATDYQGQFCLLA